MARKPRVQVDDPLRRTPDLKVRPLAPDVFVGAQGVSGAGRGLLDLADALSGLSNTTGAIAKLQQQKQAEENQMRFESLPRTDKVAAVASGYNPDGTYSPRDPGTGKVGGRALGETVVEEAEKELSGMDLGDPGFDADRWAADKFAPLYKRYENDHYVRTGLHEEFQKFRASLTDRQAKARIKKEYDRQNQAVFAGLRQEFADARSAGLNEDQLYEVVVGNERAIRTNPLFRSEMLTGKDWNDQMLAFAKDVVDENPKLALRLIQEPRMGVDGKTVGPLALIKENADAAQSILDRGLKSLTKANELEVADNVSAAMLARALNGEHIGEFKDYEHMPEGVRDEKLRIKVSADTIKKEVSRKYDAYSAGEAARLKEKPQETLGREINERARIGIVNEQWKTLLKSSITGLSERSLQEPNTLESLQSAYQLYHSMRTTKPYFLAAHMDKETSDFFDMVYMAKKYDIAKSDDDAYLMAIRAKDVNDSDPDQLSVRKDVKRILNNSYANQQDVYRHLSEAAQVYTRMGISAKEAVKLAEEKLDMQGAEVNGWYVPIPKNSDGSQAFVPDKWPEAAELLIEKWYDKHGSPEYKPSELTLTVTKDGTYTIVRKADGSQVYGLKTNGDIATAIPFFTAKDFTSVVNEEEAKKVATDKEDLVKQQNLDQLIHSGDFKSYIDQRVGENAHWQQRFLSAIGLLGRKAFYRRQGMSLGNPLQTYTDAKTGKTGVAIFSAPEALARKGHTNIKPGLSGIAPPAEGVNSVDQDSEGNPEFNIAP